MELTLVLTHACNLGCAYCFAGAKSARAMTFDTGRRALELGLDAARDGLLDLSFLGGEPLAEWDLLLRLADEAASLARARGVRLRLAVTTNGTLLTDERARALAERGFAVAVSIDGVPAAQDLARPDLGGRPSSARVERGLAAAVAHVRRLTTILVVDPRTVGWLADGVRHVVAQGARRVHLNPNWSAAWKAADLETWQAAYEEIARAWAAWHRAGAPVWVSTIDPRVEQRVLGLPARGCGFGDGELAVAPSGRVYACGRVVGEDRPDAGNQGARAPLGSVDAGVACGGCSATTRAEPEECLGCAHRDRCNRGCGCAAVECGAAPGEPPALLCWHERVSIPLADRAAASLFAAQTPSFMARFYDTTEVFA